jgi:peptidoglycan/LPS O-acetylase OafA/YrhL
MGLVRLFLAWVVAADHWRTHMLAPQAIPMDDHFKLGLNAGYAVMFFYVISGFLITYTLTRNYERDLPGALAFYRKRFIRIFSLYWPLVIVAFLTVPYAWKWFAAADLPDKFTNIFLIGIDWRIAFASYPATHNTAAINGLGQAWTLGAELVFYLLAPLLLRSWKIGFVLLCLSLAIRMGLVVAYGPDLNYPWTYLFFPSTLCFFMFGHLICLATQRWRGLNRPAVGLPLLFASMVVMTFGAYQGFDSPRFWLSLLLFVAGLPGLFEVTKNIRWFNALGDLSYPAYLVHYIVLIVAGPFLAAIFLPLGSGYLSTALWIVVVTAVAFTVHKALEMPVANAMKRINIGSLLRAPT